MLQFIVRRTLSGLLLLITITALTFLLMYSSGDNVARNILGEYASQDQVDQKARELGLDQPLLTQMLDWFSGAIQGDLGRSWFTSEPVSTAVLVRLPVTLTIVAIIIVLTALLATLLGIAAAKWRGWADGTLQIASVAGYAIPAFIVAVVLVTIFAVNLRWFPTTGWVAFTDDPVGWARSLVLPVAALLLSGVAATAQQVRSSLLDVLNQDFIRTLRSRGFSERRILLQHALRAAAPPSLAILSLQTVSLLGGTVVVEQIFALPGIGFLSVQSTSRGDLPVVLGVVILTVLVVVVVNLVIDLLVAWLNPKVRPQ